MIELIVLVVFLASMIYVTNKIDRKIKLLKANVEYAEGYVEHYKSLLEKEERKNKLYRETLENIAYNDNDCALDFSYFAETEAKEVLWRVDNKL